MDDNAADFTELSNTEILAKAKDSLRGKWGKAASLMLAVLLLEILIPAVLNIILPASQRGFTKGFEGLLTFFVNAFLTIWALKLAKYDEWEADLTNGVSQKIGSFIGGSLMVGIFTFLWTLLLIIPGIIAALNYAMTFYILMDNPAMPVLDAIKYSKKMMYGNRWKLICFNFRFLGWGILIFLSMVLFSIIMAALDAAAFMVIGNLLIFAFGGLFLFPYVLIANAHFYNYVRNKYEAQNGAIPATEYTGMSTLNTVLLLFLVFICNAGAFFTASFVKSLMNSGL